MTDESIYSGDSSEKKSGTDYDVQAVFNGQYYRDASDTDRHNRSIQSENRGTLCDQ